MKFVVYIGGRELEIQGPSLDSAIATASANYPGEAISGFYVVQEAPEDATEPESPEGAENGD